MTMDQVGAMKEAQCCDENKLAAGSSAPTCSAFRPQLESLLNRNCMENGSNTPDFILAEYLRQCLVAFDQATTARDAWYGIAPHPGWQGPNNALSGFAVVHSGVAF
jgi:hypothetical protein